MDARDVILGLVSVLSLVIGAILKTLWDAVRAIERDLPSTYVRRDDFADYKGEVIDKLDRIDEKLDDLIRR